ncbi:hypothetical protein DL764_004246 [Monosporascus ibericus]|uniref:Ent-kaurene synthase n=1 Tax=Monosporascus ibericus TaxID=155417 RepID=A0A4Q4THH5_9PEZI|nr:hypothetical protein DL764_004246 [Monosporascus ibericus]
MGCPNPSIGPGYVETLASAKCQIQALMNHELWRIQQPSLLGPPMQAYGGAVLQQGCGECLMVANVLGNIMGGYTFQLPSAVDLGLAARSLLQQAIEGYDEKYGFGSMSAAIYDTAWVSLVAKSDQHGYHWLFPQCFQYILDAQLDDGSWGPNVSQIDSILNTAASLLALRAHLKNPLQLRSISSEDLERRVSIATAALEVQLSEWDVAASTHVGFEIIVPAMLELLAQDDILFRFPGEDVLKELNSIKMARFSPDMLYSQHKTSMIHSLEAFVGKIDFDRVSHHKILGSMMSSPSATAAYLMNASHWDDESESYLRHVVERNGGIGGIPSAYPSTYFEYTWRDPSFSANCNILLALIHDREANRYLPQISKIVHFLCTYWWDAEDIIKDKWSLSHLYPTMLLVEALADLVGMMDKKGLSEAFDDDVKARLSVVIFQACFRTLMTQLDDGSWNGSIEQTAYGVLMLTKARRLSMLAALKSALSLTDNKPKLGSSLGNVLSQKMMRSYVGLFRQTPLFSAIPEWQLRGSFVEAALFQRLLRTGRLATFPRTDMEEDKYFDIIPFTWTACNNRWKAWAPSSFLFEMMNVSFLNYQADEYMEAVAGPHFATNLPELRVLVDELFHPIPNVAESVKNGTNGIPLMSSPPLHKNGVGHANGNGADARFSTTEVIRPLSRFVGRILHSPRIAHASKHDRQILAAELRVFLQAHITQHADNTRFRQQETGQCEQFRQPSCTFFNWVRTTSADHTSCPYSFTYVSCLLSSSLLGGAECFPTVTQKYFANAACRHLATMCRMYNDYGSVRRDAAERNLNSVNFPEFAALAGTSVGIEDRKEALFRLAEFERGCLERSLECLEEETREGEKRKFRIFRMFCDVTDLYGQIYVVKDIASSMRTNGGGHQHRSGPESGQGK